MPYVILRKALQGKITLFQGRNRLRGLRKERPLNSFSAPAASSHHGVKTNPHVGCEETSTHWKVAAAAEAVAEEQGQRVQTQHKEATGLIQRLDSFAPAHQVSLHHASLPRHHSPDKVYSPGLWPVLPSPLTHTVPINYVLRMPGSCNTGTPTL